MPEVMTSRFSLFWDGREFVWKIVFPACKYACTPYISVLISVADPQNYTEGSSNSSTHKHEAPLQLLSLKVFNFS